MNLQSFVNKLYENNAKPQELEKVAERAFLDQLSGLEVVEKVEEEKRPLADISTDDLYAMIKSAETSTEESADEDLEKVAGDILGGQIMAHAMVHEFALIKQAVAHGLCRVCKEHPMDVEGSSICSACGQ